MKTRIIHTKIWIDGYFIRLSSQEKLLFLYYLTNRHVSIIHLYECHLTVTSMETGLSVDTIKEFQIKFERAGKIHFFQDYIYLKNASKYEKYTGELNEKAKGKLLNELSHEVLEWYKSKSNTPIDTDLIPSITHNLKPKTYSKEQMNEDVDPADIPF